MIKEVKEIPGKKKSIRELLKNDINEAISNKINKFEFCGYDDYKYLAKYAKEVAYDITFEILCKMFLDYKNGVKTTCTYTDFRMSCPKDGYIEILKFKEKKEDIPRVFGEIHFNAITKIFQSTLNKAIDFRKRADERKKRVEEVKNNIRKG